MEASSYSKYVEATDIIGASVRTEGLFGRLTQEVLILVLILLKSGADKISHKVDPNVEADISSHFKPTVKSGILHRQSGTQCGAHQKQRCW